MLKWLVPETLRIGAFDLLEPIGRGGMGEVWRGIHREQQIEVAVKVIAGDAAQKKSFQQAFRREVRAVAGLDHPGIVMVLDTGEVPEGTGSLVAGSPYLVMELANGGT